MDATTTYPNALLTLRVDVQNAASRVRAPLTIKTRTPTSLAQLHELLQSTLADAIDSSADASDTSTANERSTEPPMAIDVEIYDAHRDAFVPLHSLEQLAHRRVRLNVVLHDDHMTAAPHTCLALPSKLFDTHTFTIAGVAVSVGEVGNSGQGTGLTTWDGSVVLAKYLEHAWAEQIRDKRVLELGAGTGLVGLAAALLGAREVVLTDLAYTMANLQRNVDVTLRNALNNAIEVDCHVETRVVDWFDPPSDVGAVDIVLASDVVWVEALIPPLVATFDAVLRHSAHPTTIIMAHQTRSVVSDALLFAELERFAFRKRQVPTSDLDPRFVSDRISVWEITRAEVDAAAIDML